jgi:hypothetical protein
MTNTGFPDFIITVVKKLRTRGLTDDDIAHLLFLDPIVIIGMIFLEVITYLTGTHLYWIGMVGITLMVIDMVSHYNRWWTKC